MTHYRANTEQKDVQANDSTENDFRRAPDARKIHGLQVHSISTKRLSTATTQPATLLTPTNTISAVHQMLVKAVHIVTCNGQELPSTARLMYMTTPILRDFWSVIVRKSGLPKRKFI